MSILRCLTILMLFLFLTSVTQVFGEVKFDSDSGSFLLDPNENLGNFLKVRYYAWGYAKNNDANHDGWYCVWVKVGDDSHYSSGDYDGILNHWGYKEKDRYMWQEAPSLFDHAYAN